MNFAVTLPQIPGVKHAHRVKVTPERIDERKRQHGHSVLLTLAVTHEHLPIAEVDIFHA